MKSLSNYKVTLWRSCLLAIAVAILALPSVSAAFFEDVEDATANELSAGTLSFAASATTTSSVSPANFEFSILNTGSHLPQYSFSIASSTCVGINFATSSNAAPFSGIHNVSVSGTPASNCGFSLVIEAWQQGFDYGSGGFTASSTIEFTVILDTVQPGDVVINEVMWMGSEANGMGANVDDWIELRNTTSAAIDLSNWEISNAEAGGSPVTIPVGTVIPANGYVVLSRFASSSTAISSATVVRANLNLNNSYNTNGQLVLLDGESNIIDSTLPAPVNAAWPAGVYDSGTQYWSMERNDDPSTGWHTCDPTGMTPAELTEMQSYWKPAYQGTVHCGTPGGANLSWNDPSSIQNEDQIDELEAKNGELSDDLDNQEKKDEDEAVLEDGLIGEDVSETAVDEDAAGSDPLTDDEDAQDEEGAEDSGADDDTETNTIDQPAPEPPAENPSDNDTIV